MVRFIPASPVLTGPLDAPYIQETTSTGTAIPMKRNASHQTIHPPARAPLLFRPFRLGPLRLKNRIVALPLHTGFAHPDGRVSSLLLEFTRSQARSGAGMVVTANAAVSEDGAVSRYNLRIDRDEFLPGLHRLAETIQNEGAVACLQLNHAGRFAKSPRPLLPAPLDTSNFAFNIASLKKFMHFFPFEKRFGLTRNFLSQVQAWRRGMDEAERERVIRDFAGAAVRAARAGFEAVELHGANGYLLCQFLSSFTHKRREDAEDDFAARAAFPLAVVCRMRQSLPTGFPIGFRLLLNEWVPGGIDLDEALKFARLLEAEGIAYLSASVGTYNSIFSDAVMKTMARPAYLREEMAALKKTVRTPVVISGRIVTPGLAEKMVREGIADLVGLGRPLLADAQWIQKAREDGRKIRACINCHTCLKSVVLEQGITCVRWSPVEQKRVALARKLLTRNRRALWIVTRNEDRDRYRAVWPFLLPDLGREDRPVAITYLDRSNHPADRKSAEGYAAPGEQFSQWIQKRLGAAGFPDGTVRSVIPDTGRDMEKAVRQEIAEGGYGLIAMAAEPGQAWRRRLLYQESGKVMGWIGTHARWEKVIVAVDFSDAALMAMKFLRGAMEKHPEIRPTFCHVLGDQRGEHRKQWSIFKAAAGFDDEAALTELPFSEDVAAVLVAEIQNGNYGTVVMGKRGLSEIKRWLLGSVSTKVLEGLTDQSLFLVDG
jgi:2,4-dienoyl-CoA reductase (NADPH2)